MFGLCFSLGRRFLGPNGGIGVRLRSRLRMRSSEIGMEMYSSWARSIRYRRSFIVASTKPLYTTWEQFDLIFNAKLSSCLEKELKPQCLSFVAKFLSNDFRLNGMTLKCEGVNGLVRLGLVRIG